MKCNIIKNGEDKAEFLEFESPIFQDNRHIKVVKLSALSTGRFYPPPPTKEIFWYSFLLEAGLIPRA